MTLNENGLHFVIMEFKRAKVPDSTAGGTLDRRSPSVGNLFCRVHEVHPFRQACGSE